MDRVKCKSAFEHAYNVQIQLILHSSKYHMGLCSHSYILLYPVTFIVDSLRCPHMPEDTFLHCTVKLVAELFYVKMFGRAVYGQQRRKSACARLQNYLIL